MPSDNKRNENNEVEEWIAERRGSARKQFLVLEADDVLTEFDSAIENTPTQFQSIFKAFRENVASAITVGCLPYTMASASSMHRRFDRVHMAERIRNLPVEYSKSEVLSDEALIEKVSTKFQDLQADPKFATDCAMEVLDDLYFATTQKSFDRSASELLRQCLAMAWSALELFLSDLITAVVNDQPKLALALVASENTRKYFPSKNISIEALAEYGFDLRHALGDVLFSDLRFDRLSAIRNIVQTLFPSERDLHVELAKNDYWLIWQRRHLIVHRRGVIDDAYISKTGDKLEKGTLLTVPAKDLESALNLVSGCGVVVARAVTSQFP